jgi:predicted nuclease with TOPRIM domain
MLSLEQVKQLNTKVERAIEYVRQLNEENAALEKKLENNQKRLDELEVLVTRFKEEQGRIEDGILSALDRLNQFENAVEKSLAMRTGEQKPSEEAKPSTVPEMVVLPETDIDEVLEDEDEDDSGEEAPDGELDIF